MIIVANNGFALYNYRYGLISHLSNQGYTVIVAANDEANFKENFASNGITFIDISVDHKGLNPFADIGLISKLRKLYKQESPSLIHHFTIKPVIFGTLAAKLASIPSIINTITGLGYVFGKGGMIKYAAMALYKLAFMGKPHVIFQNKDDYSFFTHSGLIKPQNAHIILGSGINTQVIRRETRKRIYGNRLRFFFFSRMLWDKGVGEYVRAAEKVKTHYDKTSWLMLEIR